MVDVPTTTPQTLGDGKFGVGGFVVFANCCGSSIGRKMTPAATLQLSMRNGVFGLRFSTLMMRPASPVIAFLKIAVAKDRFLKWSLRQISNFYFSPSRPRRHLLIQMGMRLGTFVYLSTATTFALSCLL